MGRPRPGAAAAADREVGDRRSHRGSGPFRAGRCGSRCGEAAKPTTRSGFAAGSQRPTSRRQDGRR
jgi:hypothetical protein